MQNSNTPLTPILKAINKLRQNLEFLQRQKEPNPKKIGVSFGVTKAVEDYYNESESYIHSFKSEYEALQDEFSAYKIKMEEMKCKFEMICFLHGIVNISYLMDFHCSKSLAIELEETAKYNEVQTPLLLRLSEHIEIISTAPEHVEKMPTPEMQVVYNKIIIAA